MRRRILETGRNDAWTFLHSHLESSGPMRECRQNVFVLLALMIITCIAGCSTVNRVDNTVAPGTRSEWRESSRVIPDEVERLLRESGITVVSVWSRDADLMAVLDVSRDRLLETGWTILVGHGPELLARISIIEVDGRSAIGLVTLVESRLTPQPVPLELQQTAAA